MTNIIGLQEGILYKFRYMQNGEMKSGYGHYVRHTNTMYYLCQGEGICMESPEKIEGLEIMRPIFDLKTQNALDAGEHRLQGFADTRSVILDGRPLSPADSQKYYNHSPDGFNWGYCGSGPAQLALAIMLHLTGNAGNYQSFKQSVIATLPMGKDFDITFKI